LQTSFEPTLHNHNQAKNQFLIHLTIAAHNSKQFTLMQDLTPLFSLFLTPRCFSHTKSLWIVCRIHDLQHTQGTQRYDDRFNRRFLLKQGWNHIEIELKDVMSAPKNRTMNPSQMLGIGLFVVALREPQIIYLDNIQLSD